MPKTANFSVGKCPRCGKELSQSTNPHGTVAYCDCWKYHQKCGDRMILKHNLKDETVAMLQETLRMSLRDVVAICPGCMSVATNARERRNATSRLTPQEVTLTNASLKVSQGRLP
ncbi:hypothetical protein MUP79_08140 [Candidatus Bathyarchaeota archaeon]|nr:hypothetical protein [Candidatus Bathyarchaeota archaeon]